MRSLIDLLRRLAALLAPARYRPGTAPVSVVSSWSSRAAPIRRREENHLDMGDITLRDSDPAVTAAVQFKDSQGADTVPDDVPQWASSDETVATVVAAADGLSATVKPGVPGMATVSVSSTDLDGTKLLGSATVKVTAGEAATAEISFAAAAPPVAPAEAVAATDVAAPDVPAPVDAAPVDVAPPADPAASEPAPTV